MKLKEINCKVTALNTVLSATNITPSSKGTLYPIAPAVTVYSTKGASGNYNYFFRIVVFIDSDATEAPTFCIDEATGVDFYVVFDLPAKEPTNYTPWYIEANYEMSSLRGVTVFLQNNDPRTSRGTVTTVIVIIPDGVSSNC